MKKYSDMSPTEKLMFARTALDNALNTPEIASAIANYGYNASKINEGKALADVVEQLNHQKNIKYSELLAARDQKAAAFDIARKAYTKYVKLARTLFAKNALIMSQLGIVGKRAKGEVKFIEEATRFYAAALSSADILSQFVTLGIHAAHLQTEQAAIFALRDVKIAQRNATTNAERATAQRNEKIKALNQWMSQFLQIARIALEDDPHWLEALGVLVRGK